MTRDRRDPGHALRRLRAWIKSLLEREPRVRRAEVRFAEGRARLRYNGHALSEPRLREVIENGSFEASSSA